MARLPSKLPTADDLGALPSARTGRNIARLDIDAYGAPGRGMAAIGQSLASLGASITEAQDRNEDLDVQQRLLEIEQQSNRQLDERRRTLTGDPSGFADSTRNTFTETGREAFNRARESGMSERGLQRLARGMAGIREGLHSRAYGHELNQRGFYGEDWTSRKVDELRNDYLRAPDDASRERIFRDAERTVQLGRERYGFGHEAERRLRTGVDKMLEDDALARPDSYAALLELREGDRRLAMPSTGEISELGMSRLEAASRMPGMTPAQIRAEEGRLRTEAGALSKMIQSQLQDGVNLTQGQHDALVSYGVRRGRDALQELLPRVNTGDIPGIATTMRGPSDPATAYGRELGAEQQSLADQAKAPGPLEPIQVRPVPRGRSPAGARPRQGNVEGIVLHHTAGTTLDSALSQNQLARTGYNYYIDRDGSAYVFAPDNQRMNHVMPPGSSARIPGAWPHLSSENTIGISVVAQNDGDMTDAQRNTLRSLTTQLATQHGVDAQNIIGHGDIQHTRERDEGSLSREFREGGRRVAQRSGTMTDASPAAPSDPSVEEYADLIEGRGTSSRYSRLPADRRRVLIGKLEHALRPSIMADMDDDLEMIRQTGQPRRLPDGTTSFSRAARLLTPNQFERYQLRLQEAQSQYRALHGLQDMTPEEVNQRRQQLSPTSNVGERFNTLNRTRTMFETAVERLQEEGQKDPAQSVEGGIPLRRIGTQRRDTIGPNGEPIPGGETDIDHRLAPAREVAEAHDLIRRRYRGFLTVGTGENGNLVISQVEGRPEARQAQQDAWRIIMDARMAAQERRGIPERFRAPITKAEAEDLLNMPRRVDDPEQFDNLMRAAVDRAYERYGPYARRALDAAIRFRANLSSEQSRTAAEAVQKMVDGVGYSPEEVQRLSRVLELDREQAAWMGRPSYVDRGDGQLAPWPPAAFVPRQPAPPPPTMWQRMTGGRPTQQGPGMSGAPISGGQQQNVMPGVTVQWPKPTPQDITDLQRFPDLHRAFDSRFGPGAAAAYLRSLPQP